MEATTWICEHVPLALPGGFPVREPFSLSEKLASRDAIEQSISHMREHLGAMLTLSDLAGSANLSVSHYSAIFRKRTGYSPGVFPSPQSAEGLSIPVVYGYADQRDRLGGGDRRPILLLAHVQQAHGHGAPAIPFAARGVTERFCGWGNGVSCPPIFYP